jgi:hypothetical protein
MIVVSHDTKDIIDEMILKAVTQTGSMLDFITNHELQETIKRIDDRLPGDIVVRKNKILSEYI